MFRSARKVECYDRALVLTAVGMTGTVVALGDQGYALLVHAEDYPQALAQLARYEAENPPPPPDPPAPRTWPFAWVGSLAYVLVLLAVALAPSRGWVRLDAFDVGDLWAAGVRAGQWWRAWTALTLHLDGPHLAANLAAGVWFGYLAGRQLGVGTAWLLTVSGAALSNLGEGMLAPAAHRSVGASTAVFTALGVMAAYSWRERWPLSQRWSRRWGPLVAGLVLLGWTGSAGEGTDVVAHVGGFGVGLVLGALAATPGLRAHLQRVPQWLTGALALVSLAVAWTCALKA